jgi:hypothetical protein
VPLRRSPPHLSPLPASMGTGRPGQSRSARCLSVQPVCAGASATLIHRRARLEGAGSRASLVDQILVEAGLARCDAVRPVTVHRTVQSLRAVRHDPRGDLGLPGKVPAYLTEQVNGLLQSLVQPSQHVLSCHEASCTGRARSPCHASEAVTLSVMLQALQASRPTGIACRVRSWRAASI